MKNGKPFPIPVRTRTSARYSCAKCPAYCCSYPEIEVTVEDKTALVQVDEDVDGPEKAVQAVCLIPLPEGADVKAVGEAFHGAPAERIAGAAVVGTPAALAR